jgi:hypothetical protein
MPSTITRKIQVIINEEVVHEEIEKDYNVLTRAHYLDKDFRAGFLRHNGIECFVVVIRPSKMNKVRFNNGTDWWDDIIKDKVIQNTSLHDIFEDHTSCLIV